MTEHKQFIDDLRADAARRAAKEPGYWNIFTINEGQIAIIETAAADLLEIHDATGMNLIQAPGLQKFVEAVVETGLGHWDFKVKDNGA